MAKGKIINRILIAQQGLAQQTKLRIPKSGLDLYFQITKKDVSIRKKSKQKKERSEKQHEQRTLYCDCDLLYKILKRYLSYFLYAWYNNLPPKETAGLTIYQVFMRRCLKRDLADLLRDYLKINISYIEIEELEDHYLIKTHLYQYDELGYEENYIDPKPRI